jgi:hypothetical protein
LNKVFYLLFSPKKSKHHRTSTFKRIHLRMLGPIALHFICNCGNVFRSQDTFWPISHSCFNTSCKLEIKVATMKNTHKSNNSNFKDFSTHFHYINVIKSRKLSSSKLQPNSNFQKWTKMFFWIFGVECMHFLPQPKITKKWINLSFSNFQISN